MLRSLQWDFESLHYCRVVTLHSFLGVGPVAERSKCSGLPLASDYFSSLSYVSVYIYIYMYISYIKYTSKMYDLKNFHK